MCLFLACSVYLGNRHMVRTLRKQKTSLESCGTQPGISRYIFVCTWLTQNIEHKGPKGSISRKVCTIIKTTVAILTYDTYK